MKFNLQNPQPVPDIDFTLRVGNVYPSKNTRHTKYWIVVAVNSSGVHLFGLNGNGEITTSSTLGKHVFDGTSPLFTRGESLVGRCESLSDSMDFKIEWL
jgi:hypothetical protein